ncbi:MAG: hypothetical protein UX85_C0006G0048, partial [Candidatus Beckwithbacteria bacterium GW2011_GWB1_47_15]
RFHQHDIEYAQLKSQALGGLINTEQFRELPNLQGFRKKPSFTWLVTTNSHGYWRKERLRWYPNGKKIVPHDIKLTPMTLAVWYMDDGTLQKYKGAPASIRFCTNGFDRSSIDILMTKLQELGFAPHLDKMKAVEQFIIRLNRKDATAFLNVVNPYLPSTMLRKKSSDEFNTNLWKCGTPDIDYDEVQLKAVEKKTKLVCLPAYRHADKRVVRHERDDYRRYHGEDDEQPDIEREKEPVPPHDRQYFFSLF